MLKGGTIIGTSRCPEFRLEEGRKKATLNLIKHEIGRLICIGGDGSLTGANLLSLEWNMHLKALVSEGSITEEQAEKNSHFVVVGMVGSIDNDFNGTDMTIGADSALNRIVSAVDAIMTTASSHQRSFVIEVMGRNCGYLAVMTALATGADYAFIPEYPTPDDWRNKMCRSIKRGKEKGRRHSIVIVSEGAKDYDGNHLSAEDVKNAIESTLGYDTRITILGHVQRGGSPSSYDRMISTQMGVEAVNAAVEATEKTESMVIGICGGKITRNNLVQCVKDTQNVTKAIQEKQYNQAISLRGIDFERSWLTYLNLTRTSLNNSEYKGKMALMTIGAPAPGMNNAARALTRLSIDAGYPMLGIYEGIRGLSNGEFKDLKWIDVDNWAHLGGAVLGTNREQPDRLDACISNLIKFDIKTLFVIGGWEAYTSVLSLAEYMEKHSKIRIPIIAIPATISNNCPGTTLSIGTDTALNIIVQSIDSLKISAIASRCRVFVMEVEGGKCGYLAVVSTLSGGAHVTYTPEDGIDLFRLYSDVQMLRKRFEYSNTMALIINNEKSNSTYTTEMIDKILNEEAHGSFDARKVILGHIQQGNNPSPLDRVLAADMAFNAMKVATDCILNNEYKVGFIGTSEKGLIFTPASEIVKNMDFDNRRPIEQSWYHILECCQMINKKVIQKTDRSQPDGS